LQYVRELVRDRDLMREVEIRTPHDDLLVLRAVVREHAGTVGGARRLGEVDLAAEQPEPAQHRAEPAGVGALRRARRTPRAADFLRELIVGKKAHRYRMLEVETAQPADRRRDRRDARIPSLREPGPPLGRGERAERRDRAEEH